MQKGIPLLIMAMACPILVLASSPTAARPDSTIQINPSDDTCVAEDIPDTNLGSNPILYVTCYSISRSYLRFPLREIPSNALVISAKLNLFHLEGDGSTQTYDVHRVTESWSEETATWNKKPGHAVTTTASLSFDPKDNGKWRSWDVTPDLDSTALTEGWVSLCIKCRKEGPSYDGFWGFCSKEYWGGITYIPYLEIAYNVPPTLSSGSVIPATGEWGTSFTYEVTYTDADGDLPLTYPRLFIDGETAGRIMTEKDPADTTVTDGKVYKYVLETTSENIGIHNFYFRVEDAVHGFSARYPPTGGQDGPDDIQTICNLDLQR